MDKAQPVADPITESVPSQGASQGPSSVPALPHTMPQSSAETLTQAAPANPDSATSPTLMTPPAAVTAGSIKTTETVGLPSSSSPLPDTSFTWGGYFQAIGILIVLLAVLWYVLRLVRRFAGGTLVPTGALSRHDLRMEAQLSIGPRKGVVVVRFLNKRLLLGVTDQQISLLSEMDVDSESPNGPDGPRIADGTDGTDEKELASKFQRLLQQALPGKAAVGHGASASAANTGPRRA